MNQDMMKRLTLKASKQIVAADKPIIKISGNKNAKHIAVHVDDKSSLFYSLSMIRSLNFKSGSYHDMINSLGIAAQRAGKQQNILEAARNEVWNVMKKFGKPANIESAYYMLKDHNIESVSLFSLENKDGLDDFYEKIKNELGSKYQIVLEK